MEIAPLALAAEVLHMLWVAYSKLLEVAERTVPTRAYLDGVVSLEISGWEEKRDVRIATTRYFSRISLMPALLMMMRAASPIQLHVKLAICKYKSLKLQNEMEGAAEGENVRVELAVCFVGAERAVGEVAGDRGFLGEGHDVERRGQVPVVVAPEEACCTESWIIH